MNIRQYKKIILFAVMFLLPLSSVVFAEEATDGLLKKAFRILDKASENKDQQSKIQKAREALQADGLEEKAEAAIKNLRGKEGIGTSQQKEQTDRLIDKIEQRVNQGYDKQKLVNKAVSKMAEQEALSSSSSASTEQVPVPQPREVPAVSKEQVSTSSTVITTGPNGASYFDSGKRIVVFVGAVNVDHPDFDIQCDELEVYLKPEGQAGQGATVGTMGGGIDVAIARGKRVVIRKPGVQGKSQVGQCQKATYYASKEELVMQKWPQLQVGNHLFRALEQGTEMTLRKNGQHRISGAQENVLLGNQATKAGGS